MPRYEVRYTVDMTIKASSREVAARIAQSIEYLGLPVPANIVGAEWSIEGYVREEGEELETEGSK